MKVLWKAVICLLVLVFSSAVFQGQVAPICDATCGPNPVDPGYGGLLASRVMKQNARGTHNTVAMVGGPLEVPMLPGSQSYNKSIPILSLPGRGLNLNLTLWYNSRIYDVDTTNSTVTFNADRDFPSYGFRLDFGYIEYDSTNAQMILTESDGSKRSLPLTANVTGGSVYDSSDGSSIEFSTVNLALAYKNGMTVQYQPFSTQPVQGQTTLYRPIKVMDANRNYITISYVSGTGNDQHIDTITDTLGRIIKFIYAKSPDNKDLLSQIQQLNGSPSTPGFDSTGTRVWATFTWAQTALTYNFVTSLHVVSTPATGSIINVLTSCKYANGTGYQFSYGSWGLVNRIDLLSSTNTVRSYESYNFPDTSQPLNDAPAYTSMTVSRDGSSTSVWTYATSKTGLGQITSQSVTDPFLTVSTVNLNTDGSISSSQIKDSNGKIFQTVSFTWTNNLISSVAFRDDAGNQSSVSYTYDSYGNVTNRKEFDFTGTSPVRETVTTYMGTPYSGPPNSGKHILNLPQSIQVKDGSGNVKSRMDFGYDESARSGLTPFPLQNDGNTTALRGNLTSITRYPTLSDVTKKITRTFSYDAAGNMVLAQLDCCNQKKFAFTPSSQYAYLSSIVRGLDGGQQFTTSFSFNVDNGLLQSSVDENNQQTSVQYDNTYRIIQITPPAPAGQQTINYDDDIITPRLTTTTTANTTKVTQTFDGLGHMTQEQILDTSSGSVVSTTQFQYDAIWRRTAKSNPYTGSEPVVWNNTGYDVLNRVISVTPPSGGSTTFNFIGNTVLISDPAGKQRKQFFDGLGRLVRVDEPGWGDALTAIDAISIAGTERTKSDPGGRYCAQYAGTRCVDWEINPPSTIYDQGTATATINGVSYSYRYGLSDSSSTVAANLAGKINADPARLINASASGAVINLYAVNPGAGGNSISVAASSVTTDPTDFGTGTTSFPASTFTPTLTGGENAVTQDNAVLSATRHITTTYGYAATGGLVSVSQGAMTNVNGGNLSGQPRSYAYDDLGRLTSVTTPESGTVTNYYTDLSGNACSGDPSLVCRVKDARGITKIFTYNDPLNRLTGVSYDDNSTPSVIYSYDSGGQAAFALGRLTKITEDVPTASNPNAQTFTYNNLGRVATITHSISGTDYQVKYEYNAAGQMTSLTYPSGRMINSGFDGTGRLIQIADATSSATYLSINSADYTGAGEIKKLLLGNGITGQFSYNDHLQVASIRYYNPTAPAGASDVLNLAYDYTSAAQPNNNGQIQAVHYYTMPGTEDQTRSESFTYDVWKRLRQAKTFDTAGANTWNLNWSYDRLGNRLSQSGTGTATVPQPNFTVDSSSNQIVGYCYDLAGNLIDESTCPAGVHQYSYDAANRLIKINSGAATYTYFGQLRIKKTTGDGTTIFIYSGNRPIAEYTPGAALASPIREYVYSGPRLLASIAGANTIYYHSDHLSNRAETDSYGNILRRMGHFPYGESWYDNTPAEKGKFTSYERDLEMGETGLDYAQFRYYSPGQARFSAADLLGGSLGVPQSVNRYSYVLNDPVNAIDPFGLYRGCPDGQYYNNDTESCAGGPNGAGGGQNHPPLQDGGPGNGGGPVRKKAKGKIKDKCLEFILDTIKKAFNALNDAAASQGHVNVDALQGQKDVTTEQAFVNAMMGRTVVQSDKPLSVDANAIATASGNTVTLYPLFASQSEDEKEVTMIHETFHGDPYDFSDSQLADALGAKYTVVPHNPQQTESNASEAWEKKLEEKCGSKK